WRRGLLDLVGRRFIRRRDRIANAPALELRSHGGRLSFCPGAGAVDRRRRGDSAGEFHPPAATGNVSATRTGVPVGVVAYLLFVESAVLRGDESLLCIRRADVTLCVRRHWVGLVGGENQVVQVRS